MTNLYTDGRQFIHFVEGDINARLPVRLIGQSLEFKVKDAAADRLGRDTVLVPLSDLFDLIEKVDKSNQI